MHIYIMYQYEFNFIFYISKYLIVPTNSRKIRILCAGITECLESLKSAFITFLTVSSLNFLSCELLHLPLENSI